MDNVFKYFAKEMLGCGCDDTVFEEIEFTKKKSADSTAPYHIRLLIGRKLLIYITHYSAPLSQQDVHNIFSAGKKERDSQGFNRLRCVFFTEDSVSQQESITQYFNTMSDTDEKMHLHFINADIIKKLFY